MSPIQINRRAFLAGSGLSLGSTALNLLMAESDLKDERPSYLLPMHGRGALPFGDVRLQTEVG
jgi:hypothetical protein